MMLAKYMLNALRKLVGTGLLYRFCKSIQHKWIVFVCRLRYWRIMKRIATYPSWKKIRVLFLVDDPTKWKVQSLYDQMDKSHKFEPIVGLMFRGDSLNWRTGAELVSTMDRNRAYYERNGCKCVECCVPREKKLWSVEKYHADIVFFQEPWYTEPPLDVLTVSKTALCCYMPYGISWQYEPELQWQRLFHQLLFRYYSWEGEMLEETRPKGFLSFAGKLMPLGHTAFDHYFFNTTAKEGRNDIIVYAPHFSFQAPKLHNLTTPGTFEWNGREILAYAMQHPEQHWAFKPHGGLKSHLVKSGLMTEEEVSIYYHEWESIGETCYDGSYQELFYKSCAMVTDSQSFLIEYAPTGKPLIHLISSAFRPRPCRKAAQIIDSYYDAHNKEEMYRLFKLVLEEKNDPKREQRLSALRDSKLGQVNAAAAIMKDLLIQGNKNEIP